VERCKTYVQQARMRHSPVSIIHDRRLTSVLVLFQHNHNSLRLSQCVIQDDNLGATSNPRFSALVGLTGHVTTVMGRTNATASSSERGENVRNAVSTVGLLSLLLATYLAHNSTHRPSPRSMEQYQLRSDSTCGSMH
jgi:hypothetical protein